LIETKSYTLDELIDLKDLIEKRISQIKENLATSVLNYGEDRIIQYHRERLGNSLSNLKRLKKIRFLEISEYDRETIQMSELILREKFI
jgi:predicted AAA+ superfamily ATPase